MPETPVSLLDRLRHCPRPDDWKRWFDLYHPILSRWLRRSELQGADVEEIVSGVLLTVVRQIPHFEHNGRAGAFRAWLRQVMVNRLHELRRGPHGRPADPGDWDRVAALLQAPETELSRQWDREHDQLVLQRLLDLIRSEFAAETWEAFRRQVLGEEPAEKVAAALGMSVNAVRIAKCRVLGRLRQEGHDLVS
jgi:RNA polymerase sigma-70 factor (ECF subfamily)